MPSLLLPSTSGQRIDLAGFARRTALYLYPMTGRPDVPLPQDWDMIPGARGCTPEACAFRDHHAELNGLNTDVWGLSTQTTEYQREMVARLHLPFEVLSDSEHLFADALELPTFEVAGMRLLKRLTLIIRDGAIEHVFYPVFPPDTHAEIVCSYLRSSR